MGIDLYPVDCHGTLDMPLSVSFLAPGGGYLVVEREDCVCRAEAALSACS